MPNIRKMPNKSQSLYQAENISLTYHNARLLDNISFSIRKNEVFVLLGESGSGKSLLIDALAEAVSASGHISTRLSKSEMGFSFDTFSAFTLLNVREIIDLLEKIYQCAQNETLLKALQITDYLDKRISVLSKGERRRLGIYAALFHTPRLAILDEPTDGLDPKLRDVFWEIVKQRKGAVFLTTHLWNEAYSCHDRIAFMSKGRLLAKPMPGDEAIKTLPYTGKIVTAYNAEIINQLTRMDKDITGQKINDQFHLYYKNEKQKQDILSQYGQDVLTRSGYSILPIHLMDVYYFLKQNEGSHEI